MGVAAAAVCGVGWTETSEVELAGAAICAVQQPVRKYLFGVCAAPPDLAASKNIFEFCGDGFETRVGGRRTEGFFGHWQLMVDATGVVSMPKLSCWQMLGFCT